jgi:NTE family protein
MEQAVPQKASDQAESPQAAKVRNLWEWVQDLVHRLGRKPKIGLALGSGSAWGVAHVGVLSAFKELNIPISYLSGCSAGSFVGALYAGGVEGKDLEAYGIKYGWRDAGRLSYVPTMGLATNDRMASYLDKRIGNPEFKDLRLPFYVVATNLTTGRLKVFDEGPVIPAVRASCAMPGIFAPVSIDGELYCDGGVLDMVPCDILRKAGADLVIGVELRRSVGKRPVNIFEVISRAFDIAVSYQVSFDDQTADLIIRPKLDDLNEFAFNRNHVLIERGRESALEQLKHWQKLRTALPEAQTEPSPDAGLPDRQ